MEKDIVIYKIYLITLFVAYLVTILFNVEMFTLKRIISLVFGIGYCILAMLCLWGSFLISSNSKKGFLYGIILGFIIFIYSVLECFLPGGFILKNLRVVNLIYPIFGVLLILMGINVLYIKKEVIEIEDNSIHKLSHNKSRIKEMNSNNKENIDEISLYDGLIVDGYIKNVLLEDDHYSLEIEYLYEGEKYIFYYEGIDCDVSDVLDKKKLRRINVYLPSNSPEYAQIDEELLMYMINN